MRTLSFLIFIIVTMPFCFANGAKISYEDFIHFSKSQKIQTVELVHEYLINLDKISIDDSKTSEKKNYTYQKIFNLFINSAYAADGITFDRSDLDSDQLCFYAGWMSIRVQRNGESICMHPKNLKRHLSRSNSVISKQNKSLMRQVSQKYEKAAKSSPVSFGVDNTGGFSFESKRGSCNTSRGDIVCNPTLFGHKSSSPICVQGDSNLGLNSSLLCNQALNTLKEESPDEYLATMDEILSNAENQNKDEFFYILDSMYDTCLCGSDATTEKNQGRFRGTIDRRYAEVMFNQRTCFGLINQTEHIIESIRELPENSPICSSFNSTPLNNVDVGVSWLSYLNDAYKKIQEQDISSRLEQLISERRKQLNNTSKESQRDSLREQERQLLSQMRDNHFQEYIDAGLCPLPSEREENSSEGGVGIIGDSDDSNPDGNLNGSNNSEDDEDGDSSSNNGTTDGANDSNNLGDETSDSSTDELSIVSSDGTPRDGSINPIGGDNPINDGGSGDLGGVSDNVPNSEDQSADSTDTAPTDSNTSDPLYKISLDKIDNTDNDQNISMIVATLYKNDNGYQIVSKSDPDADQRGKVKIGLIANGLSDEDQEKTSGLNYEVDATTSATEIMLKVTRIDIDVPFRLSIEIEGKTYISKDDVIPAIASADLQEDKDSGDDSTEKTLGSNDQCSVEINKEKSNSRTYKLSIVIKTKDEDGKDVTYDYSDKNSSPPEGTTVVWYKNKNEDSKDSNEKLDKPRMTIDSGEEDNPKSNDEVLKELDGLQIISDTVKAPEDGQYAQYPAELGEEKSEYGVHVSIPNLCSTTAKVELDAAPKPMPGNNKPYQIPSNMGSTPRGGGILRGQR